MNKKEVGLFVMATTCRVVCDWVDFHKWAEQRLGRKILTHEFRSSFCHIGKKLEDSITSEEWKEIADYFMKEDK
jgi:hypothetical protein